MRYKNLSLPMQFKAGLKYSIFKLYNLIDVNLIGAGGSYLLLGPPGLNWCISFAPGFSKLFGAQISPLSGSLLNLSPRF